MTGRFAPSPTGDLHVGNLRTAAIAWLSARSQGAPFLVRMEDLDLRQSSVGHEAAQLRDLTAIGLDWDGEVVRQSDRFDRYEQAITDLEGQGLVYECYCTRREILDEIRASAQAPHGPPGSYSGTCRDLTGPDRAAHRADGRRPALRLRSDHRTVTFTDRFVGPVSGVVDDVVLRRNDGVPAYNLAVVVDDAAQGVTEVARGDDLVSSTPRQIFLQQLLGLPHPSYLHVPLVVDRSGERLAKRRGRHVTIADLGTQGVEVADIVAWIVSSLGCGQGDPNLTLRDLIGPFVVDDLPRQPCPTPPFVTDFA